MARKRELSSQTQQSILVLRNEGHCMQKIAKKLKISNNGVYYSLQRTAQTGSNQNRKRSGRPRCTTKQEDKYIRVSSLRNERLTGPQLPASVNGTRKTPISTSTVKRRLRDAGLLGRVAKKKPYLRLANCQDSRTETNCQTTVQGANNGLFNPTEGCNSPEVESQ